MSNWALSPIRTLPRLPLRHPPRFGGGVNGNGNGNGHGHSLDSPAAIQALLATHGGYLSEKELAVVAGRHPLQGAPLPFDRLAEGLKIKVGSVRNYSGLAMRKLRGVRSGTPKAPKSDYAAVVASISNGSGLPKAPASPNPVSQGAAASRPVSPEPPKVLSPAEEVRSITDPEQRGRIRTILENNFSYPDWRQLSPSFEIHPDQMDPSFILPNVEELNFYGDLNQRLTRDHELHEMEKLLIGWRYGIVHVRGAQPKEYSLEVVAYHVRTKPEIVHNALEHALKRLYADHADELF